MAFQITFIREFMAVYQGNELVIGVILAIWLVTTGMGSYAGKFISKQNILIGLIPVFQIFIAITPLLLVFFLQYFRIDFFPPGQMPNLNEIILLSFVFLTPFTFSGGMLFTLYSTYFSRVYGKNLIGNLYAIESAGGIIGGIIASFVILFLLSPLQSLVLIFYLNSVVILLWLIQRKKRVQFIIYLLITALSGWLIAFSEPGAILNERNFPDQNILSQTETPFGKLTITESWGQKNFTLNGVPVFTGDDIIGIEEKVHFVMIQKEDPQNILLIGGGFSGTITEILKYGITSLDYLEISPEIVDAGKRFTDNLPNDPRLNVFETDARIFITNSDKLYDVIITDLPDPDNLMLNRYFTHEFFSRIKKRLQPGGVFSISLTTSANYLSQELLELHTVLNNTLNLFFENVIIINGSRNYFISSDNSLSYDITDKISNRNILTNYINEYYIDKKALIQRSRLISDLLVSNNLINKDFRPICYSLTLRIWGEKTGSGILVMFLILLFLFIMALITKPVRTDWSIFITGYTVTVMEIIVITAIQIFYGYVYFMTGIIITIFMAGLLLGSGYLHRWISTNINVFTRLQFLLGITVLLTTLFLWLFGRVSFYPYIIHLVLFVLLFGTACLSGVLFSMASNLRKGGYEEIAGNIYSIDLIGSAFGGLLVSGLLIPVAGILPVCIGTGILNFLIPVLSNNKK